MSAGKRRRPYPRRRHPRKTVFSAAMWLRWLAEQSWASHATDCQTLRLREGIEDFRRRIVVSKVVES